MATAALVRRRSRLSRGRSPSTRRVRIAATRPGGAVVCMIPSFGIGSRYDSQLRRLCDHPRGKVPLDVLDG
eukprot:CAMPEP_0206318164 /NCGR_PEP_ID=MMETSP0106_2-20121207/17031_1 /ASSEMBLY_ACC=CAM_ASM_000206 /TAXON_ID=81532 /ORGANISM="Acanthoeca-like sp., Strain 10tr" /LENGTH=70 /DNA_ID=CAMNT_0053749821 /DNA_START=1 /DNA_END=210 /DNA_ORIENTATION=+